MSKRPIALHREAYPCLDIFALQKAWFADQLVCEFYDKWRRLGDLVIEDVQDESFRMSWLVYLDHICKGQARFQLRPSGNPVDGFRHYLVCPGCDRKVAKLYLKVDWKCGTCHGLSFRSRLLTPAQKRTERRLALEHLIGPGRPPHMRQRKYDELLSELKALRRSRLPPAVPNTVKRLKAEARWLAHEDVHEDHRNDFIKVARRLVRASMQPPAEPLAIEAPPFPVPAARREYVPRCMPYPLCLDEDFPDSQRP